MIVINRLRPKIKGYLSCLILKKERKEFRNPKKLSEAFAEQRTKTAKKVEYAWAIAADSGKATKNLPNSWRQNATTKPFINRHTRGRHRLRVFF